MLREFESRVLQRKGGKLKERTLTFVHCESRVAVHFDCMGECGMLAYCTKLLPGEDVHTSKGGMWLRNRNETSSARQGRGRLLTSAPPSSYPTSTLSTLQCNLSNLSSQDLYQYRFVLKHSPQPPSSARIPIRSYASPTSPSSKLQLMSDSSF